MKDESTPPASADRLRDRPFLVLVTSHWLSLLGIGLAATALISWLFVLPVHLRGHVDNPYLGIVVFLIIPIVLVAGLAMIPAGVFLARRRARRRLAEHVVDRKVALRRLLGFLGGVTLVNVVVGTQATYRAVEHMETVQFCGQTCHVMTPELRSHAVSPHARVPCVECHVGEGARGWLESKMAGTRQLVEVITNSYPRPIPSAMETNRLVPARETCETCHWPEKFVSARVKLISKFAEDEANTPSQTVLTMMVGGSLMPGIHSAHFGPGVEIRYAAADGKRQKIPWVEYRNTKKGETRSYRAEGVAAGVENGLPHYAMQCVDCHNRPTHTFELPDRAVDKAMATGLLPTTLPFLKKKGVELLKADYASNDEAGRRIPAELEAYYRQTYPKVASERGEDVAAAAKALVRIYDTNVFPDLRVGWGAYPNNLGHEAFPGCFRCHDEAHKTADGKTISQDCGVCHEAVAMDESSPEVLKTLGLESRILALRKP
jgi:NapC/NirT cytochrome c family, N-terminal region